jgi:hypothetical protein
MPYAPVPAVCACIELTNQRADEEMRGVSLNCKVHIEPQRRTYNLAEQARLFELFGEPAAWHTSMKPLHWTRLCLKVPSFLRSTSAEIQLPCSLDFDAEATRYFYALDSGSIPVTVQFSGTCFYVAPDGSLQSSEIQPGRHASFDLPVTTWQAAVAGHYGDTTWLRLPRSTYERLSRYKLTHGLASWQSVIARLLTDAGFPESATDDEPTAGDTALVEGSTFESVHLLQ